MLNMNDVLISGVDVALAALGLIVWTMRVTEPDVCTEAAEELSYPADDEDDDETPATAPVASEDGQRFVLHIPLQIGSGSPAEIAAAVWGANNG